MTPSRLTNDRQGSRSAAPPVAFATRGRAPEDQALGKARLVEGEAEQRVALQAFTEQLLPGRWAEVRQPSPGELKAVSGLALPLQECSAKVRSGPPLDDEQDLEFDVWAGVVPLTTVAGPPLPDPGLRDGLEPSPVVLGLLDSA